ncbi:hypothetical protein Q7P36_001978 [Cladosporium allicinum]
MAARHEDTSWHHNCVLEDSPDVAGWRWELLPLRRRRPLLQLFAGTFTHSLARQALSGGSLAALELLTRSAGCQPKRQYDSSGLSHPAQPVGRRGASFGCATLKDPLLARPVDLEPCILVLLPLTGPDRQLALSTYNLGQPDSPAGGNVQANHETPCQRRKALELVYYMQLRAKKGPLGFN